MFCEWEHDGYKLWTTSDPHSGPMRFLVTRPDGVCETVNLTSQEVMQHHGAALLALVVAKAEAKLV
jgi:hypothetical protein